MPTFGASWGHTPLINFSQENELHFFEFIHISSQFGLYLDIVNVKMQRLDAVIIFQKVWVFLFQQAIKDSLSHSLQTFPPVFCTLALFMASLAIIFFLVFMMSNMFTFFKASGFPVQFYNSSVIYGLYSQTNKCSYHFSVHLEFFRIWYEIEVQTYVLPNRLPCTTCLNTEFSPPELKYNVSLVHWC